MPYALDAASYNGFRIGLTWEQSHFLINQQGDHASGLLSDRLIDFLSTRTFAGGNGIDILSAIGEGRMRTINGNAVAKVSGAITPLGYEDPFVFGLASGLRNISLSGGRSIGGSLILGTDGATMSNASRLLPESNIFQVLVHGTPDGFIVGAVDKSLAYSMTPKELARALLSNSNYSNGTKIRLISCNTGACVDGAAYQLSRYLKVPVLAPSKNVRILEGGMYEISKDAFGQGVWKEFFNTTIKKID